MDVVFFGWGDFLSRLLLLKANLCFLVCFFMLRKNKGKVKDKQRGESASVVNLGTSACQSCQCVIKFVILHLDVATKHYSAITGPLEVLAVC